MSKSLSRTLYLIGVGIVIVATILIIAGFAGSTGYTDANGYYQVSSVGHPALVGIAIFLYVAGGIVGLVAYIGALIKMAMLGRWGWFVCLLLISGITMLVYIFAGPTTRADAQLAAPMGYAPQGYPPQGYPQQGYPQQQGYPPQQGYAPMEYPPQQGYPPAGYPPQQATRLSRAILNPGIRSRVIRSREQATLRWSIRASRGAIHCAHLPGQSMGWRAQYCAYISCQSTGWRAQ